MMTTFEDLFLSTSIVGYIGPLALALIGGYLALHKKYRIMAWLFFIVEMVIVAEYLQLVEAGTYDYWWQILILLFGGLFTFVYPLWDRI